MCLIKAYKILLKWKSPFLKENSNPKSHCPTCENIALNVTCVQKRQKGLEGEYYLDSTTVLIFLHIKEGEQPVKEGGNFLSQKAIFVSMLITSSSLQRFPWPFELLTEIVLGLEYEQEGLLIGLTISNFKEFFLAKSSASPLQITEFVQSLDICFGFII